jgi:hypothetical protein
MLIIGCDFHTRYQQIAMMDSESGELVELALKRECRCKMRMSGLCKVEMSGFMGGRGANGNGAHCLESTRTGPVASVA